MTAITRCASTLVSLCMVTKRCPAEERGARPASTTGLPPGAPELDARTISSYFEAQARAFIGQGINVTVNMLVVGQSGTPFSPNGPHLACCDEYLLDVQAYRYKHTPGGYSRVIVNYCKTVGIGLDFNSCRSRRLWGSAARQQGLCCSWLRFPK